jgi:ribonuclease P protein component
MRAARLRRGEDIARVRAEGIARNDKLFSLRALTTDLTAVRVAVASSRAVGGAVERNRARRRVREALRVALEGRRSGAGADLLVMARPAALSAPAIELREALERELDRVFLKWA